MGHVMSSPERFPIWFVLLTSVLVISNFAIFGLASLLEPTFPFKELGEGRGAFPVQFFAIRHIAFSIPLAYGLGKRNPTVLAAMYTMFLVMAVLDLSLIVVEGYFIPVIGELSLLATLVIGVPGFIGSTSLGLWHLSTYRQTDTNQSQGEIHAATS